MNTFQLVAGLCIAVLGPLLTLAYLRQILLKVLARMCSAAGGSEFWLRSSVVLTVAGSVWLTLMFGFHHDGVDVAEFLRRALLLTTMATFVSVAVISRRIWKHLPREAVPDTPATFELRHGEWNARERP